MVFDLFHFFELVEDSKLSLCKELVFVDETVDLQVLGRLQDVSEDILNVFISSLAKFLKSDFKNLLVLLYGV